MNPNPSYYTLPELIEQYDNCVNLGMDTSGIAYELALVVDSMSLADVAAGKVYHRPTMNRARDILDERNRFFFDQDRRAV